MTTPAPTPSETDPVALPARGAAGSSAGSAAASSPAASAPPPDKPLPAWRERLKGLIAESGAIVLWVYFSIFGIVLVGFALAIRFGANVQGAAGTAGTWGAAYLATKLTQPLRIAATLAITPALASLLRRFRGKRGQPRALPASELPRSESPPPEQP